MDTGTLPMARMRRRLKLACRPSSTLNGSHYSPPPPESTPARTEVVNRGAASRVALLTVDAVHVDAIIQQLTVKRLGTVLRSIG